MNTQKMTAIASKGFILLSALSLLSVCLMALTNPQSVMDLVNVKLENNDAISSIRGIYGGVGLALVFSLLYLFFTDVRKGLAFLCLFWGFYALSRIITILVDGSLGDFGTQWLAIESILFLFAIVLLSMHRLQFGKTIVENQVI